VYRTVELFGTAAFGRWRGALHVAYRGDLQPNTPWFDTPITDAIPWAAFSAAGTFETQIVPMLDAEHPGLAALVRGLLGLVPTARTTVSAALDDPYFSAATKRLVRLALPTAGEVPRIHYTADLAVDCGDGARVLLAQEAALWRPGTVAEGSPAAEHGKAVCARIVTLADAVLQNIDRADASTGAEVVLRALALYWWHARRTAARLAPPPPATETDVSTTALAFLGLACKIYDELYHDKLTLALVDGSPDGFVVAEQTRAVLAGLDFNVSLPTAHDFLELHARDTRDLLTEPPLSESLQLAVTELACMCYCDPAVAARYPASQIAVMCRSLVAGRAVRRLDSTAALPMFVATPEQVALARGAVMSYVTHVSDRPNQVVWMLPSAWLNHYSLTAPS